MVYGRHGSQSMDYGPWTMVINRGPWNMVHGPRSMGHDPCAQVHGPRSLGRAPIFTTLYDLLHFEYDLTTVLRYDRFFDWVFMEGLGVKES